MKCFAGSCQFFSAASVRLPSVSFKARRLIVSPLPYRQIISRQRWRQIAGWPARRTGAANRAPRFFPAAQHHRRVRWPVRSSAHVARATNKCISHSSPSAVESVQRACRFRARPKLAQKFLRQQRDVPARSRNRRQLNFHHAQPEKQILTERAALTRSSRLLLVGQSTGHRRQSLV